VEGHALSLFEDEVVSKIIGCRRDEAANGGEKCMMKSFVIILYILSQGKHVACIGK
jgi:hypothetical protein